MTNVPNAPLNAELPFVSQRNVDVQLSRMLRRQPESESAETARLKLLDELDDYLQHMRLSTYKHMTGVHEELAFIGQEMTHELEFISGLRQGQQVMAGRGSAIMTIHRPTGDSEVTQIPDTGQVHGCVAGIEVVAFNYDLTPIATDAVPRGIVYKPLLLLRNVFALDEQTAAVNDYPESNYDILVPLDDETVDLRKSNVLHEPHK